MNWGFWYVEWCLATLSAEFDTADNIWRVEAGWSYHDKQERETLNEFPFRPAFEVVCFLFWISLPLREFSEYLYLKNKAWGQLIYPAVRR